MRYSIWSEGYIVTGNSAEASYLDSVEAESFEEACELYFKNNPELLPYFDKDSLTYWGCKLYDNESDARSYFG